MIFVAILASALMAITGMAVEGSRIAVEYRQMQNAADMAALVGAQSAGCATSGIGSSSCIQAAIKAACDTAYKNGYGGGTNAGQTDCTSTSSTTVHAYIPPQVCSPYSADYGNGKVPSNSCSGSTTSSYYNYLEVTIQKNLGTVPLMNVGIQPYAHAIAKKGSMSPRDFALVALDHTLTRALSFSGNAGSKSAGTCGVCIVGSIMSNSSDSSSIYVGGSGVEFTCGGQWYTNSTSETTVPNSNMGSYSIGSAFFSPPGCTGTADTSTSWNWGQPTVDDPYGSEGVPGKPSDNTSAWPNCTPCASSGHYFHWKTTRSSGSWDDNGVGTPKNSTSGDNYEYFPGSYPSGITINGGNNYFNPGTYNLGTGGLKDNGGNVCVFGAPICDQFSGANITGQSQSCGSASMDSSRSNYLDPQIWYYYCSGWGTWDTSPPAGNNSTLASTLGAETPYFTIGVYPTAIPLNGVTFYSTKTSGSSVTTTTGGSVDIEGNAVMSLAFPDPCPGTYTGTPSQNKIPFQSTMGTGDSGATQGQYTYPSGSVASGITVNGVTGVSPKGELYPSADLTAGGEGTCRTNLPIVYPSLATNQGYSTGRIPDVWNGESGGSTNGLGQLLQFIFFMRDATAGIQLAGGGTQIWWGIIYNPGNYGRISGSACGSSATNGGCQISLGGSSGSSTNDIPMVVGQIIGDGVSAGGSSTLEIFYRPCDPRTSSCEIGPGSTLVQ